MSTRLFVGPYVWEVASGDITVGSQQAMLCEGDAVKESLCPVGGGYTKIYAPDGQSISSELAHAEDDLVLTEIDSSMIAYAKAAADPTGHYSRPDVTSLMLNSNPQRPDMAFY